MVRHASLFSQLVALFNRQRFHELVFRHGSERYAKGFSSWDQFVAMLFCQIGQAKSLREISGGLASSLGKLRHLGVKAAPNKSTLSYANAHRPWQLFQDLFYQTLDWCRLAAPGKVKKFRFKNKLLSLDSSTISFVCRCFPGRSSAAPRAPSNCICYWITTVICPVSPASPTVKRPMYISPGSFL